ncbi:pyridoxal 5'-phosphate synthase (glutamine hydrolyzing) [Malassezia vespertilionis]|uniref:glutaminase n=1 Tax=Malassezia vespertilionis TaxID=2020962 RepID=A0A2N1JH23_9BASI|nr:pyridoxal 5'-phosphate synthase (glutamine hydrolyzing) [Malassezia vespertilionis]PKI85837.1 hypothetical protein MVES_000602 [Malassezia vespertilionis]WFD05320.1 pyridoxal 5'-phosphate synthase (glutamine hydrolyzing) [Malassezia vespertilionis]
MSEEKGVVVGVLAMQGAFQEHITRFCSLNATSFPVPVRAIPVRTVEQLAQCDGVVIPGGESTAISLGLQNAGLFLPLQEWIAAGKPVWGTCAGMIMLSSIATGGKRGGQWLLGGMAIQVGRNGFGSQVYSFESDVDIPALGGGGFPGVFIRAPVVEQLLSDPQAAMQAPAQKAAEPLHSLPRIVASSETLDIATRHPLQVLGTLPASNAPQGTQRDALIVAVRQGRLMASSFHPELTSDTRLHAYFLRELVLGI